ncbi:putative polyprotein [Phytophthora cinnamomi]|uniref:putative polyprotein n=1 Tax=Phytophthora cinnamomi TaxID=4785 RepID=UPI00355A6809|nr:putative polyprotein [Phytophthora cinnamomi]
MMLKWERLYGRTFRPDEPVREYIAGLLQMQRDLAENNDPISDPRLAKIVPTKAHAVYPVIADEVTERLQRDPSYKQFVMHEGDWKMLKSSACSAFPIAAELPLPTQPQANAVQQTRSNGKGPRRSTSSQRGSKYGGSKSSGSKSSGSSTSSSTITLARMAKKKMNS